MIRIVILAALVFAGCGDGKKQEPRKSVVRRTTGVQFDAPPRTGVVRPEGYAGSEACRPCHESHVERWRGHSMARTGLRPIGKTTLPASGKEVLHTRSGYTYRAERRGDDLFVVESLVTPDGQKLHERAAQVTHTFGSGTYGVALAMQSGRWAHQFPIAYYPASGGWGLDPGFGHKSVNPRFGRVVSQSCVDCHADPPAHQAGDPDALVGDVTGVGCEKCHGPGAKHAETGAIADVVNPAKLPVARQIDVCAQCHLQGAAEFLRAGRERYSYRPGEPLHAYRMVYVEEAGHPRELGLTDHAERLVRSACFDSGIMTCSTCHDVHASSVGKGDELGRKACLKCHEPAHCTAKPPPGASCAGCHMAKTIPIDFAMHVPDIDLMTTDHWIQKKPPAPPAARPEKREKSGKLVTFASLLGETPAGDDVAVLEALAWASYGGGPDGRGTIQQAAERGVKIHEIYDYLGMPAAAAKLWPDDVETLTRYASWVMEKEDWGAAERAADRALVIAPDHPAALTIKGRLHARAGRTAEARTLFTRAGAALDLAVLERGEGRMADAAHWFERARAEEPKDPRIYDDLAAIYDQLGDTARRDEIVRLRALLPK